MRERDRLFTDEQLERFMEPQKGLMFDLVEATRKDKREHGFSLCWDETVQKPELWPMKVCTGNGCTIQMTKCPYPTQFATFHTHPKGGPVMVPSERDLVSSIAENESVFCIGAPLGRKGSKVRCYTLTDDQGVIRSFLDQWRRYDEGKVAFGESGLMDTIFSSLFGVGGDPLFFKAFEWERK